MTWKNLSHELYWHFRVPHVQGGIPPPSSELASKPFNYGYISHIKLYIPELLAQF